MRNCFSYSAGETHQSAKTWAATRTLHNKSNIYCSHLSGRRNGNKKKEIAVRSVYHLGKYIAIIAIRTKCGGMEARTHTFRIENPELFGKGVRY